MPVAESGAPAYGTAKRYMLDNDATHTQSVTYETIERFIQGLALPPEGVVFPSGGSHIA